MNAPGITRKPRGTVAPLSIKLCVALTILVVGQAIALVWIFSQPRPKESAAVRTSGDRTPREREALLTQMLASSEGLYDSHPDPDVGRILLPNLKDRACPPLGTANVSSNAFGMRERPYPLQKPEGTLRVVLLGDSYVFGWGVAAEQRVGHHLETLLDSCQPAERRKRVECLNFGVVQWNLIAESEWLRRQIEILRPDLVIHFVVENDLNDNPGVRGFGASASFSTQYGPRADAFICASNPVKIFRTSKWGWLNHGLDWEGAQRMRDGARRMARLRAATESSGGRYEIVIAAGGYLPLFRETLGPVVAPQKPLVIPVSFQREPANRFSATDHHWSPLANQLLAYALAAHIHQSRTLEIDLRLPGDTEWQASRFWKEGLAEYESAPSFSAWRRTFRLERAIDLRNLSEAMASQIHGGVDDLGQTSPYASLVLERKDCHQVRVTGEFLSRGELKGARVQLEVDGIPVGELTIDPGRPFSLDLALPSAADPEIVTLSLRSDDYVYDPRNLRHCIVLKLHSIAALTP